MLRSVTAPALAPANESERTLVRHSEQSFGRKLTIVAKALWPTKTAAHLAARIGCSTRAAEFYLSGDREWSGPAVAAILAEIIKRE